MTTPTPAVEDLETAVNRSEQIADLIREHVWEDDDDEHLRGVSDAADAIMMTDETDALRAALRASEAERERLAKAFEDMERGRNWFHRNSVEQAETIGDLVGALEGARGTLFAIAGPLTADAPARGAAANAVKRIDAALSRTRPSGGDADGGVG